MATPKSCLKSAKEALAAKRYTDAVAHAQAALQFDERSYDALVYVLTSIILEKHTVDCPFLQGMEVNA